MTQMVFFLTEYAEEFSVLLCSVGIVLLLVTLHRMKRITKLIQEIAGNTRDVRQAGCERKEENPPASAQSAVDEQKTPENMPTTEENAKLLSEVLEEVFP